MLRQHGHKHVIRGRGTSRIRLNIDDFISILCCELHQEVTIDVCQLQAPTRQRSCREHRYRVPLARLIDGLDTDELVAEDLLASEDQFDFFVPKARLDLLLLLPVLLHGGFRVNAELVEVIQLVCICGELDLSVRLAFAFRVD